MIIIYGSFVDFFYRCCFKIMNFSDRFRQSLKLFYSFEKQLFMDLLEWNFQKNTRFKTLKKIFKKTQRDGV